MKLVIGIVRPEKTNEVLEALYRAEVRGFSMSRVQGHGGELDRVETYRGTTVRIGLAEKVRFEIAVSDEFVEPTIEALCEGGRTGEVGDGKIFVLDLEQVVRIRTGETDNAAVTPVVMDQRGRHRLDAGRHRAGAADDAGAGALLRRPGAGEEHAEHVHDVRRRAGGGDDHVGARSATRSRSRTATAFIGGLDYLGLSGVAFAPREGTHIPHLLFFAFQATFCIVTTALVAGAVVERMRFGPFLVFAALWSVLVYAVLAHWAWGGGWLQSQGTLDFAGGVPVEMGSGFSALAAALVVGARKDYGRQALLPHNSVYVLLGAGLLWFGWFGFNGGSGFSAGNTERAGVRQHAAHPGLHAGHLVRARPAALAPGDGDRRGDGDRGRLRRDHARRRASSARAGRWRSASSPRCPATR